MEERRNYGKAFKLEAVRLLLLSEVPAPGETETTAAKTVRLERELSQVREERDILKRAAAYFARELP